jgi:hypothetical protein
MTFLPRNILLASALVGATASLAFAQLDIAPPPAPATQPETPRPPSATMPSTSSSAATAPAGAQSAQSVLENLLQSKPASVTPAPIPPAGTSVSAGTRPGAVAPNQPAVGRIPEGGFVWNRVGRLAKDDKSGEWLFVFDADGKNLKDPPMGLVPSRMLMAMQRASENGTKPTKFRVSGEVTEYEGKNYLYVKDQRIVQDLNQGIGG